MGAAVGPAGVGAALPRRALLARRHRRPDAGRRHRRTARAHRQDPLRRPTVEGHLRRRARRRRADWRVPCEQRGIGAGDVVAFQLPNWMEAAVSFWAAALLGAVVTPIVHFYGPKEVVVHPAAHGRQGAHHRRPLRAPGLPRQRSRRSEPTRPPWRWWPSSATGRSRPGPSLSTACSRASPLPAPAVVDPSSPALVAYTSGTTADPKGVVHSHRTIGFEIRQLVVHADRQSPAAGGSARWGTPSAC